MSQQPIAGRLDRAENRAVTERRSESGDGELLSEHRPSARTLWPLGAVAVGMIGGGGWFVSVGLERSNVGMGFLGALTCWCVAAGAAWAMRHISKLRVDVHRNGLRVGPERTWVPWSAIRELRVFRSRGQLRVVGIMAHGRDLGLGPGLTDAEKMLEAIEDARPDLRRARR